MYLHTLTSLPYRYGDRGGVFRQCRITRQQRHRESDGAAPCSYAGTRPPGIVACAHDNRPLLGLVAFMGSKQTLILVAWCHRNSPDPAHPTMCPTK